LKVQFQDRPWDLHVCAGYTLVVASTLIILNVGNFTAILLVVFVPGYALVAALFPSDKGLDWVERSALSICLSIAIVPLLGIFMNLTSGGIRFLSMLSAISFFTLVMVLMAYWRRASLDPQDRLAASFELRLPNWEQGTIVDKILTTSIVVGIIVAVGIFAYGIITPRPAESFTEFYVLCSDGTSDPSCYPTRLNVSQPATVIIGVVSHEPITTNYTVRVDLVGVRVVQNMTCACNQTLELNRTAQAWFNITLGHDKNWSLRYTFSISRIGLWKVQFFLFANEDFRTAYREIQFVTIT